MDKQQILCCVDHTLLSQTATLKELQQLCDDAIYYHTASVCIPPDRVKEIRSYVENRMRICTVIGFPNGYHSTKAKAYETEDALQMGADEIDMVIHLGHVKEQRYQDILEEMKIIKNLCEDKILKVIIETCFLTDIEKIKMCELVTESGADYIKTSTGFGTGGATFEDIALFRKYVGENVKIKAAGGIADFEDAERMLILGASRLGTSRLVKQMKTEKVDVKHEVY